MRYRIIDGEVTDPLDVWDIGLIRKSKRIICLPEDKK